jgi:hypothetical protein
MSTAEELAFSIREERRGAHVLLWDDQGDLARALLIFRAALGAVPIEPMLLASTKDAGILGVKISARSSGDTNESGQPSRALWLIFLQQASAILIGPWLNGWRGPLSEPPGTLLLIRHADYEPFQRAAPDLASYAGPRVYDAARMLSLASSQTISRIDLPLPGPIIEILRKLPGTLPPAGELEQWARGMGELAADQ